MSSQIRSKPINIILSVFGLLLLFGLVFIVYSYVHQDDWISHKMSLIEKKVVSFDQYIPSLPSFIPFTTTSKPNIEHTHNELNIPILSEELARKHSRDNVIFVTWANLHFADFALNWVHHVKKNNITNYLVGAMDSETAKILTQNNVQCFALYEPGSKTVKGLSTAEFGWGGATFHKMGRSKVQLASTFTSYGLDLCLCDVDTVFLHDPTEYFASIPEADILVSSDLLNPTNRKGDPGLEQPDAVHSAMNIGLIYFRYSANTTFFIDAWMQKLKEDETLWDQGVFNDVAHQGQLVPFQRHPLNSRVFKAFEGKLYFGILPVASFTSGHTYFVQNLYKQQQLQPYIVHTTFQYGGTEGKRNRMRERLLFNDPIEYYTDDVYIAFDLEWPDIVENFATHIQNEEMILLHLTGMEDQLKQLRNGLAIAHSLNRTVILPKMLCLCDRFWAPVEQCRIPGAMLTTLPFVCPADHIVVPKHFTDNSGPDYPGIPFKEYSFLSNPHAAALYMDSGSVLEVSISEANATESDHKERLEENEKTALKNTMKIEVPALQTDVQWREALDAYSSVKVIKITSSIRNSFGGFVDPAKREGFMARFRHILDFWCCRRVPQGEDGGFAYAKFFGEEPGKELDW